VRWSVDLIAEGDREMTREEIVELADAVAGDSGIATGIGTPSYGAQLLVDALDRDEAVRLAQAQFARAVEAAGLPVWPVVIVNAISEDDDEELGYG
jgi:hypothetical protein